MYRSNYLRYILFIIIIFSMPSQMDAAITNRTPVAEKQTAKKQHKSKRHKQQLKKQKLHQKKVKQRCTTISKSKFLLFNTYLFIVHPAIGLIMFVSGILTGITWMWITATVVTIIPLLILLVIVLTF